MKGFEKENFLKFFFLCGCYSFRQAGISFSGSKVFFQKSNFSIHGKRCSSYLLDASGIRCSHFCDKYFPGGGHVFIFNRGLQHITSLANVSSGSIMCLAYLILHIHRRPLEDVNSSSPNKKIMYC